VAVMVGAGLGVLEVVNISVETFTGLSGPVSLATTAPLILGPFLVWSVVAGWAARATGSLRTGVRAAVWCAMVTMTIGVTYGLVLALATPGELARQLGMSAAALTNRLDALERRGYVERAHDRDDRRKVVATLTPAGNELWQRGIGDIQRVEEELVHHLPEADRTRLDGLLRRLVLVTEKNS